MKRAFTLLLMTSALGAGLATFAAGQGMSLMPPVGLTSRPAPDATLTLIDDDGEEGNGGWFRSMEEDDDDDCEGDDDGGDCASGAIGDAAKAGNAAKAGTVAPPKNGLFTDGAAPVVTSN